MAVTVSTRPSFTFSNPERTGPAGWLRTMSTPRSLDVTPDGKGFISVVTESFQSAGPSTTQIQVVLNWTEELKQRVSVK